MFPRVIVAILCLFVSSALGGDVAMIMADPGDGGPFVLDKECERDLDCMVDECRCPGRNIACQAGVCVADCDCLENSDCEGNIDCCAGVCQPHCECAYDCDCTTSTSPYCDLGTCVLCAKDEHCDDSIDCTIDKCTNNQCSNTPDDSQCGDIGYCDGPGQCDVGAGGCTHPTCDCDCHTDCGSGEECCSGECCDVGYTCCDGTCQLAGSACDNCSISPPLQRDGNQWYEHHAATTLNECRAQCCALGDDCMAFRFNDLCASCPGCCWNYAGCIIHWKINEGTTWSTENTNGWDFYYQHFCPFSDALQLDIVGFGYPTIVQTQEECEALCCFESWCKAYQFSDCDDGSNTCTFNCALHDNQNYIDEFFGGFYLYLKECEAPQPQADVASKMAPQRLGLGDDTGATTETETGLSQSCSAFDELNHCVVQQTSSIMP